MAKMHARKSRGAQKFKFGSPRPLDLQFARGAAILMTGMLLAGLSFAVAVAGITRYRAPDQALAFVPWEGVALAAKTDRMFQTEGDKVSAAKLMAMSREAILYEPVNPRAIRNLAIAIGLDGQSDLTEDLVQKAAGLTRRDTMTQLLLVEEAESRGDRKAALRHYDAALRTSSVAPQLFFPRLAKSISDPKVRAALIPYLRSKNSWAPSFFSFAATNNINLSSLVDLTIESGGLPDPLQAVNQRTTLLSALLSQDMYSDFRRLLLNTPGVTPEILNDASLDTAAKRSTLGPAVWQAIDDAEAGAAFGDAAEGERVTLSIYANAGTTRPVAQKILFLRPGSYRFSFDIVSIEPGEEGSLSWQLQCLEPRTAQPIWLMESLRRGGQSAFSVPPACRTQMLVLIASGGRGQSGMEATLSNLFVRRAEAKIAMPSETDANGKDQRPPSSAKTS